jgi:TPR repeat protein
MNMSKENKKSALVIVDNNKNILLEKAANQGDKIAQYKTAIVKKNEEKFIEMVKYYKLSANQGYGDAAYELGMEYLEGKNIEFNSDNAIQYMNVAYKENNNKAMYQLGTFYIKGLYVEKNVEFGIKCLEKAASLGAIEANYELGKEYLLGNVLERNITKATQYLEKSSSKGHADSKYLLATVYIEGSDEIYKNYSKAINLLKEAIDFKHVDSHFLMGKVLIENKNNKESVIDEGIELMSYAAEQEHVAANEYLGKLYSTKSDYDKAKDFYTEAQKLGSNIADKELIEINYKIAIKLKDNNIEEYYEAEKFLKEIAAQEEKEYSVLAEYKLGLLDYNKCIKSTSKEKDGIFSSIKKYFYPEQDDCSTAYNTLHKIAEQNKYYKAEYAVGEISLKEMSVEFYYNDKSKNINAEIGEGIKFLESSLLQGYAKAGVSLAKYYYSLGDKEKAFEFLAKSAEIGDIKAKSAISYLYIKNNELDKAKNYSYEKAISNLKYASEAGYSESSYILGAIKYNEKDEYSALKYFNKAIEQGSSEAEYILGVINISNSIINTKKFGDLDLLDSAAKHGSINAKLAVTEIQEILSSMQSDECGGLYNNNDLSIHGLMQEKLLNINLPEPDILLQNTEKSYDFLIDSDL